MSNVIVARAARGDVQALAELIRDMDRCYGDPAGYSATEAMAAVETHLVSCPGRGALLARDRTGALGLIIYASLWPTVDLKPALFVKDIFVREHARGKGVGRALLGRLASMAMDEDYSRIDWTTDRANAPARAAYRAMCIPALEQKLFYRLEGRDLERLAKPKSVP